MKTWSAERVLDETYRFLADVGAVWLEAVDILVAPLLPKVSAAVSRNDDAADSGEVVESFPPTPTSPRSILCHCGQPTSAGGGPIDGSSTRMCCPTHGHIASIETGHDIGLSQASEWFPQHRKTQQ